MDNSALSYETFNYEKARAQLPDGYEPLPFITIPTIKKEKLIRLSGFSSENDARDRIIELNAQYPSDQYKIVPHKGQTTISEYAIIVPESAKEYIKEDEMVLDQESPIVTLTDYSPILYRFLGEKRYEDSFFEKGELLISTFARCKTAEVKDRRDNNESTNRFIVKDGKEVIDAVLGYDFPSLLLCTSLSQENLQADGTPYQYGFKINNPGLFLDILTRAFFAKGIIVYEVLKGPCVYNNKKITINASGTGLIHSFIEQSKLGTLNFSPTISFIHEQAQNHILMNKPTNFSSENEYRFVWKLARPIRQEDVAKDVVVNEDGSIIIRVPELIPFCERL